MKKLSGLILSAVMLISSLGHFGVYAENENLKTFNEVLYTSAQATEENKGWTSEASKGASVTSDEEGNIVIQPNGTGERYAFLDIADTTSDIVSVSFNVNAKLISGGTSFFALTDSSKNNVLDITVDGNGEEPVFTATANGTAISITDEGAGMCDITVEASAILNFATHKAQLTIGDSSYELDMPEESSNVGYARVKMQRDDRAYSSITINELTVTDINSPQIIPSADCVKNDDGTYTVTVPEEEQLTVAELVNYDYDANAPQYDVLQNITVSDVNAEVEFLPYYNAVVIKGIEETADGGSFTVHIESRDDVAEVTFNVVVTETQMSALPAEEELTPIASPSTLLDIDFEDESDNNYRLMDEYGRLGNPASDWTKVENTADGLRFRDTLAENPDYSGIYGNAMYAWLTPVNGTQTGNGYRGSRLALDNELVQRTDKINVSYDFGFYNIVNTDPGDNNAPVGMPQVISMTSEATESASIPYEFNEISYREIDADANVPASISKHLLTFVTGRTKRSADGTYKLDMTNTLGYFEPRYADEDSAGRYKKLEGFTLTENAYNFFHVDANIDFHNSVIEFTITNTQDANQRATIKTTIPKHASWNGFIVSSQKWDTSNPRVDNDIDGKDTEHYIYLDNIRASKTAVDNSHITTTAPAARELPADAIVNVSNDAAATWKYGAAYDLQTAGDNGYVCYSTEGESVDFYQKIATGGYAQGITSYTEFDFYLPKRGSYITINERATSGSGESFGNTLIISDAGICSWGSDENYTAIYENDLETGKWYSVTIVYDQKDRYEQVILTDGGNELANARVYARNLHSSYYRALWINRPSIPVGTESVSLEHSMADTYIANFRIYNRGVLQEFYPENTTAEETGDAQNADSEAANDTRLGAYVSSFVMNQVEGDDVDGTTTTYGAVPEAPEAAEGEKFVCWQRIYQNGTSASENDITLIGDASKIKYAATYTKQVGKISGIVWNDADGDGVMGEGEAVMENITVTVVSETDPEQTYTLVTDENGKYETEEIPAGEYTVTVTVPEGYEAVTGGEVTAEVKDGETTELSAGLKAIPANTPVPTSTPTSTRSGGGGGGSSSGSKVTSGTAPSPSPSVTAEPEPTSSPASNITTTSAGTVPELNKTEHYAYIVGYPEGDVRPERNITREEVATIFFRLLTDASRQEYWKQTNDFGDVEDDRWSNNAVSTMTNAEVVFGYEDGTFRPWTPIKRAEFAAMAARFDSGEYEGENKFSDIDGHWASEEINRAAERGWISGYEDGTFRPEQYITRAEAMTLINKMLERVVNAENIHSDAIFWPDNLPEMWYYTNVEEATNSHDYDRLSDNTEKWTGINTPRDWEKLERAWSTADGAGHEDSVFFGE